MKNQIEKYSVELDRIDCLIKIYYEGSLLKAYDVKLHEMESKFNYYVDTITEIVEKKRTLV